MKTILKFNFFLTFIFIFNFCQGQNKSEKFLEFNGKIINSETKEPLIFANINLVESNISTISNSNGDFTIKIPDSHFSRKIKVSFIGFKTKITILAVRSPYLLFQINKSLFFFILFV